MSNLSEFVRSRLALRQTEAGEHPDADRLLAFSERTLLPRERTQVLAHLERCLACRDVLALTAPLVDIDAARQPARWFRGFDIWSSKWSAAAAVAVLAVSLTTWTGKHWNARTVSVVPAGSQAARLASHNDSSAVSAVAQTEPQPVSQKTAPLPKPKHASARAKMPVPPQISIPESAKPAELAALESFPAPPFPTLHLLPQRDESRVAEAPVVLTAAPQPSKAQPTLAPGRAFAPSAGNAFAFGQVAGKTAVPSHQQTNWVQVSNGADRWIGGEGGRLLHSSDSGRHWALVTVADGENRLLDTIIGIDAEKNKPVELKTRSGEVWLSVDGGQHWRRR